MESYQEELNTPRVVAHFIMRFMSLGFKQRVRFSVSNGHCIMVDMVVERVAGDLGSQEPYKRLYES